MTVNADAPDEKWQRPSLEPIVEAILSLAESAAMRPIEYSIECALDGDTLALSAQVELLAAITRPHRVRIEARVEADPQAEVEPQPAPSEGPPPNE